MNKIFLLTALSLQLNIIFSQDITVSVKKGKVKINNEEFSNLYIFNWNNYLLLLSK